MPFTHYDIEFQAGAITQRKFEVVADFSGPSPKPDFRAVLLSMPDNYKPAICRANWWHDKHQSWIPLRMDLTTKSGKPMGALFATPVEHKGAVS